MRTRPQLRPERNIYKGFYLSNEGHVVYVYDVTGKTWARAPSMESARRFVDELVSGKIKSKNPLPNRARQPRKGNPESLAVANEIYRQIGGRRFAVMTGARDILGGPNFLQFRIPKAAKGINKVKIILTPDDLYTMEFYRIHGKYGEIVSLVKSYEGLYFDQLTEIFTGETGLYTSLGSNPLTRTETRRTIQEAALHAGITGKPTKRAYYKGMAEGMRDVAEQYGRNPVPPRYSKSAEIIPALNEWNLYAGTSFRAGGQKHSYDFYAPDATSPWQGGRRQFSISPIGSAYGYFEGYRLSVWPSRDNRGHETIGTFRSPQAAVKAAREWFHSLTPQRNPPGRKPLTLSSPSEVARGLLNYFGSYDAAIQNALGIIGHTTDKEMEKRYKQAVEFLRREQGGKNPPRRGETEIYRRVVDLTGVKGPGHKCDAECKKFGHTYRHRFTRRAGIYGSPDHEKITIH